MINDKVLMGLTGCARFDGEGCYISAFDIHTGNARVEVLHHPARRAARQRHVGQAADEHPRRRETWMAGSYDPDLNLTYWGVAQSKPWIASAAS